VLELILPIAYILVAIFAGVTLIQLVRAAQKNNKIMNSLSPEERTLLGKTLRTDFNQPAEIGGAFTNVPWWVTLIIFIIFAIALVSALTYTQN